MPPNYIPYLDIEKLKEDAITRHRTRGRRARRRLAILERDGFKCTSCGRSDRLTIAHIIPIRKPGSKRCSASSFKFDECKTKCVECHLIEEFGTKLLNPEQTIEQTIGEQIIANNR